ncbi:MAG: TetR/AcrR family transcriptional regulator [Micavibrio aeruginosavorus]|uniref:TetR/AcrR family transcriptional regulator n=1 Tax=Micavibrio aeruginosavorus TaxID=349221 RepID=A0A7T5UIQ7_9BACT|nr:MAG: TetR/AcrR family transcriptional regulator [Micavibrio aeruginosavorus]
MAAEAALISVVPNSNPGSNPEKRPGRPRSDKSREAILDATRKMLMHTPLRDISIEAVAKRAGVGKTTIYRWWPHKAALVMEAFLAQPGLQNILPTTPGADDALKVQLEKLIRQLRGQNGRIVANIIAEAQAEPEALDLLNKSFMNERVENLRRHLTQGKAEGLFNADLDTDMAIDQLLGPVFYRLLTNPEALDERFNSHYPEQAVNTLKA